MSNCGKFAKENKMITSVFGINTTSRGKKVFRISKHFEKLFKDFIMAKFAQSELAMVQFTQRKVLLVFFVCFSILLLNLADLSFNPSGSFN